MSVLIFQDLIDELVDYQNANPTARVNRMSKRAGRNALEILSQAHHWSYYYKHGRVVTSAPYDTGTIAYDHTGGSYERQITLSDGTFPDWAGDGVLRIGQVNYDVATRVSDSTITLDVASNPGEDVASGTSYTLYRDDYVLPADFWTCDEMFCEDIGHRIGYEHPREWLHSSRYNSHSANYPTAYTIMGSDNYQSAMTARFRPYPDSAFTLDFIYSRRARQIVFESESRGTVTTNGTTTVTGSNTVFTDDMVGSIIRIAADSGDVPTDRNGANPYVAERSIMSVSSATSLVVDQAIDTYSGVKYVISDPVDIDVPLMRHALLRCAEAQLGLLLRLEDHNALDQAYNQSLIRAREADSRTTAPRVVSAGYGGRRRLADMPAGDDED